MAKRRKPILRFFHKKPMDNPNEAINLDELAATPPEQQTEVVTPMDTPEPTAPESIPEPEVPGVEAEIPKSVPLDGACSACNGEGLMNQSTLCPQCNGTGRTA